MRILIIEDEPIISDTVTICFNLQWPEAEVVVAESGEEGLKLATRQAPDVTILDVGLPGIDGYETLRYMRGVTRAPVIMLTARDGEISRVKGLEWGADDPLHDFSNRTKLLKMAPHLPAQHQPAPAGRIVR